MMAGCRLWLTARTSRSRISSSSCRASSSRAAAASAFSRSSARALATRCHATKSRVWMRPWSSSATSRLRRSAARTSTASLWIWCCAAWRRPFSRALAAASANSASGPSSLLASGAGPPKPATAKTPTGRPLQPQGLLAAAHPALSDALFTGNTGRAAVDAVVGQAAQRDLAQQVGLQGKSRREEHDLAAAGDGPFPLDRPLLLVHEENRRPVHPKGLLHTPQGADQHFVHVLEN